MRKFMLYILVCLTPILSFVNDSTRDPKFIEIYRGDENVGYIGLLRSADGSYFSFSRIHFGNNDSIVLSTLICDNTFANRFEIDSNAFGIINFGAQITVYDTTNLYTYEVTKKLQESRGIGTIGRHPIVTDSLIYYCDKRSTLIRVNLTSAKHDTILTSQQLDSVLQLGAGDNCKIESFDINKSQLACAIKVVQSTITTTYLLYKSLTRGSITVQPINSKEKSLINAKYDDDICIRFGVNNRLYGLFDNGKNDFILCDFTKAKKVHTLFSFPSGLNVSNFIVTDNMQFVIAASNDSKRILNYPEEKENYFKWLYSWSSIYKLSLSCL